MNKRYTPRAGASLGGVALLCVGNPVVAQHVLEEIQVIGTPRDASPGDLAQSITVIQGDDLRRAQGGNLGETLAAELGVSASSFGAGASRPVIRGLAGARVRTLEDGIDSLDVATISADHAVSIDPLIAEQIEIFRGPTTLLYGSGAVGGVINTVTRRIPEFAPADGLEGVFELRGDTVADDRSAAVRLDGGSERFAWHFDGLSRDSGDYEIPAFVEPVPEPGDREPGVLPNSFVDTRVAALGGSWLGDNGLFGLALSGFETEYGIPGHEHDEVESARIVLDQTRVDIKGGWLGLPGIVQAINLRFGINDYRHTELEGQETGTVFNNEAYEGRLEFLHRAIGPWDGAFGLQFGDREFSALGPEAFVPAVDTLSYGAFLIEQRELDRWELALGARVERVEHSPVTALADVADTVTNASAAAIRRLGDDYAVAVNLQRAQRAPVAEELYAEGPHLASSSFELGNPGLGTETSRHIDVAVRKTSGTVTWGVTAFLTRFDDFIFLRDSNIDDLESGLPIFVFDQSDARILGLEAELFAALAEIGPGELDLRLYTDYVEGELSNGERLPRLPPWRFGARLQYHTERLLVGFEAARHDAQTRTAPFETATGGYSMVNADLRWLMSARDELELSLLLKLNNLLDEDARRHTSMIKEIAPLPGRNFSAAFRASF